MERIFRSYLKTKRDKENNNNASIPKIDVKQDFDTIVKLVDDDDKQVIAKQKK